MSDSAVFTTAMSSISIAVAAHTTARVQRCVEVKVGLRGDSGRRVEAMLPARGREHIRGFPSRSGRTLPVARNTLSGSHPAFTRASRS